MRAEVFVMYNKPALIELSKQCQLAQAGTETLNRAIEIQMRGMLAKTSYPQNWSTNFMTAVDLVPKTNFGLPLNWRVGNLISGRFFATIGASQIEFEAASPTLALCAAALHAQADLIVDDVYKPIVPPTKQFSDCLCPADKHPWDCPHTHKRCPRKDAVDKSFANYHKKWTSK